MGGTNEATAPASRSHLSRKYRPWLGTDIDGRNMGKDGVGQVYLIRDPLFFAYNRWLI